MSLFGQNQSIYYLTGRPYTIERNNAILTTGKIWNIDFVYAGNDVIEMNGFDKIQSHNDSVNKLIGSNTKHGEDWLNIFYSEVDREEAQQQQIRSWVKEDQQYAEIEFKLLETFLLMKRKDGIFGTKYFIYVVGQIKSDTKNVFATHAVYRAKIKNKKLKLISTESEKLPFILPQNGIL
jgi:hypothetical protein